MMTGTRFDFLLATGENENLKGPPKIASAVIFLVVDFRHFAKISF
jgi:hypothetical protein